MKKKILLGLSLVVVFLVAFIGCKSKETTEDTEEQIIHVDVEGSFTNSILDIADIVQIIKLENTELSTIGRVEKILYSHNKFYILDTKTKLVKLFTSEGKYIGNIGNNGRGPNEYVDPADISFSEDKKYFAVLDGDLGRKILYYDLEGNFVNRIKLPVYFSKFQMVNDNMFILSKINISFNDEFYNIYLINGEGNIISKKCPFDKRIKGLNYDNINTLYSFQDTTYITLPFKNYILKIEKDDIVSEIHFDFGKCNIDSKSYGALFKKNQNNIRKFFDEMNKIDKVWTFTLFARNEDWIYLLYKKSNHDYAFYYNVNNKNTYKFNLNSLNAFYNRLIPRTNLGNNKFINVLYPYTLKGKADLSFRLKHLKKNYPHAYEQYLRELAELKVDDNPVLIITKLK